MHLKLRRHIPELIVLVYALLFVLTKKPSDPWDRVIVSDGKGYYAYLPALFIYHDAGYSFLDAYESAYFPESGQLYKDYRVNTGKGIVNKYFPGPAVLWLPFFGAGHAIALMTGSAADGYSLPYQMAIAFAAFFYFWLALLILRRILRFWSTDENHIAWVLILTGLATNLIYYTVNAGCQVHVYAFFLSSAFVWFILKAVRESRPLWYAGAAFSLGMLIISRPQDGLIVLSVPFLCGSPDVFKALLRNLFMQMRTLVLSIASLMVPLLIPAIYWYSVTGSFLVYTYPGESFNLLHPNLLKFLFSFEKGWLLYTPVAALAVAGLIPLYRRSKWQFYTLASFLFIVVYVMSSWWTWNYTSYISQRVMIDFYPFLALLLLFLCSLPVMTRFRSLIPVVFSLFTALNLMQHFQQLNWIYPAGPVTAKAYFSNFFHFSRGTTFLIPKEDVLNERTYAFDVTSCNFKPQDYAWHAASGDCLVLDSLSKNKTLYLRKLSDFRESGTLLLKVNGWYTPEACDSSLLIDVAVGTSGQIYSLNTHNLMTGLRKGEKKYAEMVMYLPYIRSVKDSIYISYRNLSSRKALLSGFTVSFLKMKNTPRHDWLLNAEDPVDTAYVYRNDLETELSEPWTGSGSLKRGVAFSGKQASVLTAESPYSAGFEKKMGSEIHADGYLRVSSQIRAAGDAVVALVFDFYSGSKQVLYRAYPVTPGSSEWKLSEMFRELPMRMLNADKVKIYYWLIKGSGKVYIDDFETDIVYYKTSKRRFNPLSGMANAAVFQQVCCDYETACPASRGGLIVSDFANSGKNACLTNGGNPFSASLSLPVGDAITKPGAAFLIRANVMNDQYTSKATLVADFRHEGKSLAYLPCYLKDKTVKGEWAPLEFSAPIPKGVSASDTLLVYFYLPGTDEQLYTDDFCVSFRTPKNKRSVKK
jgi:hypothetical protein